MAIVVTVNGAARNILHNELNVRTVLKNRARAFVTFRSPDASLRPAKDQPVIFEFGVLRVFGGEIDSFTEKANKDEASPARLFTVDCRDNNSIADRRFIYESIPVGNLKAALTQILPYLTEFGVTLDPGQVNGPTLPALQYNHRKGKEVLDELVQIASALDAPFVWEIDAYQVLRAYKPTTVSAPFNITDATNKHVGDVVVEQEPNDRYANRVIVKYDADFAVEDSWVSPPGGQQNFPLSQIHASNLGYFVYNGVPLTFVDYPWWTVTDTDLVADVTQSEGTTVSFPYFARFPNVATASDAAEILAHKTWEAVIEAPDVHDAATAQALADAYLAASTPLPKKVRYQTYEHGLLVGQTQTISIANRGITSGSYTITDISARLIGEGEKILYEVVAIEGSAWKGDWRETYQQWSGGAGSTSAIAVGGGGGSSSTRLPVYFLGASKIERVQVASPAWTPASGIEVILDTVSRGTTAATVTVRLLATAGTVQARLFNVTDNVSAGTSPLTSTGDFELFVFGATLTPGVKTYRLELLPSLADTDVCGIGYVE